MTETLVPYLINLMPLIVALSGWVGVSRASRRQPVHPFGLVLLGIPTILATIAALEFIYFEVRPVYLPPWKSPQIVLLAWFILLGPVSMLLGFLARGREPRWLFLVIEAASFWLFGLGVLAVMAY